MARVSSLNKNALPADLHSVWDAFTQGKKDFTNQASVLAHSPEAFRHLYGLVLAMRANSGLPERLIEIAVVTTSKLNECPYCVAHHAAALERTGLPPESIAAILEAEVPGFSETELLVRDYARLLVERPWGIRDSVYEDLRGHFSERQIIELTIRVGLCALFNKFNQSLDVAMEDGFGNEAENEAGKGKA